jgi:hypothetical protein
MRLRYSGNDCRARLERYSPQRKLVLYDKTGLESDRVHVIKQSH